MTPEPGPHLTPDDLDAWLVGALAPTAQDHLSHCPSCQERADTEREIVALLGALPLVSPAPGFAERCQSLGYWVGGESGYLARRGLTQIANMGAIFPEHIEDLFARLA